VRVSRVGFVSGEAALTVLRPVEEAECFRLLTAGCAEDWMTDTEHTWGGKDGEIKDRKPAIQENVMFA
jgi:hypothetical protein